MTLRPLSEDEWRADVLRIAKLCGWRGYFTWRSDHSPAGFPDLTLVRPPRLLFSELKRDGVPVVKGSEQDRWLDELAACGAPEVYEWRPADLAEVRDVLARSRIT